jgi:hypothetical protein
MKNIIVAVFLLFVVVPIFGQKAITIQELKSKYGSVILAQKKTNFSNSIYLEKKVNIPTDDETLKAFVEQYQGYINMMKDEYITVNSDEFNLVKDSVKLQAKFGEKLQEDPLFNQYFLPLIATYYQSQGYTITGYNFEKPTYTFDQMVNVMIKYYEVTSVDSRGDFKTRLGVSDNGLVNTINVRRPLMESYCLYIIRQNKYKAYKALENAKNVVSTLELGLKDEDKIKRAEGAIYALLSQDEGLRTLLREDYEKNASGLPFIITFK